MKMTLDLKCSRKTCKRRLQFSCDALTSSADLARLALDQGWVWKRDGETLCPEHQ